MDGWMDDQQYFVTTEMVKTSVFDLTSLTSQTLERWHRWPTTSQVDLN